MTKGLKIRLLAYVLCEVVALGILKSQIYLGFYVFHTFNILTSAIFLFLYLNRKHRSEGVLQITLLILGLCMAGGILAWFSILVMILYVLYVFLLTKRYNFKCIRLAVYSYCFSILLLRFLM